MAAIKQSVAREHGRKRTETGLDAIGIRPESNVYWNLNTPELYEVIVRRGEGHISAHGALLVDTGEHTGRAAKDKAIVREPSSEEKVFWGEVNKEFPQDKFDRLDGVEEPKTKHAAREPAPSAAAAEEGDGAFHQAASPAAHAPSDQAPQSDQSAHSARAESPDVAAPFSLMVEAATVSGYGRRKATLAAVAAVLVICAVAALPLSKRLTRQAAPPAAVETTAADAEATQPSERADAPTPAAEEASVVTPTPDFAAEEAARREREAREREARERARRQREEAARRAQEEGGGTTTTPAAKPATASSGPKTVRVQIAYDEEGRVTQAAAVGTSPGAEAYASTAVRVARGRRFPAGKAGTTVVTIPIN